MLHHAPGKHNNISKQQCKWRWWWQQWQWWWKYRCSTLLLVVDHRVQHQGPSVNFGMNSWLELVAKNQPVYKEKKEGHVSTSIPGAKGGVGLHCIACQCWMYHSGSVLSRENAWRIFSITVIFVPTSAKIEGDVRIFTFSLCNFGK